MEKKLKEVFDFIDTNCLHVLPSPIKLSSGLYSNFYFNSKPAMMNGYILEIISDQFLNLFAQLHGSPYAVGGLTFGADFLSAGVILRAHQRNLPTIRASIARKEPKSHGSQELIENILPQGTTIILVDDVITTGGSTKKAGDIFIQAGYNVSGVVCLLDREQGGKESLERHFGVPVKSIFTKSQFPRIESPA